MIVTTNAVVLHSRRYSDSSRIVVLYTEHFGKVSVVAKGARTGKSAFGSALEPLTHTRVTLYHRKNRELHTASNAEMVNSFKGLTSSYDRLRSAMQISESVMRTQTEEECNTDVYRLVVEALDLISTEPEPSAYAVALAARLRLATIMGFGLPPLQIDTTSMGISLNLSNGTVRRGVVTDSSEAINMSTSAFNILCGLCRVDLDGGADWTQLSPRTADVADLENFVSSYFSHHLDKRIGNNVMMVLR